jgi:hypothetical protein
MTSHLENRMGALPPKPPPPLDPAAVARVRGRAAALANEARALCAPLDAPGRAGRAVVRRVYLAEIRRRLRCRDLAWAERELASLQRYVGVRLPEHLAAARPDWSVNGRPEHLIRYEGASKRAKDRRAANEHARKLAAERRYAEAAAVEEERDEE